jgi:hypothetical protein
MAYHDTQQYQHLNTIAQLPPNWHPDANPIPGTVIQDTHTILEALHVKGAPLPNVFPWVTGAIQLQYHEEDRYLEVLLFPGGGREGYLKFGDQLEEDMDFTSMNDAIRFLERWQTQQ